MQDAPSITRVGHPQPSRFIPVSEALASAGVLRGSARVFERFFGHETIAQVDPGQLLDQLELAADEALGDSDPASITHLLYTHSVNYAVPTDPLLLYKLKKRVGIINAQVVHLSQLSCTTGVYAVELARQIVEQEPRAKVLIVCGELARPQGARVIGKVIVIGEAVACCLIESAQGPFIGESSFAVDGRFHETAEMDSKLRKEYESAYESSMAATITRSVERAHLTVDDVGGIFAHNVNRLSWNGVLETAGISHDILRGETMATYGHCFTADPFINIHNWLEGGSRLPDVSLLCSSGVGATFGSVVVFSA